MWFCNGLSTDVQLHVYAANLTDLEACITLARTWQLAYDKSTYDAPKTREFDVSQGAVA